MRRVVRGVVRPGGCQGGEGVVRRVVREVVVCGGGVRRSITATLLRVPASIMLSGIIKPLVIHTNLQLRFKNCNFSKI